MQAIGQPFVLAGYCMGGTLAVAAAQRCPGLVRGLVLLAAPWDFHAPDPDRAHSAAGWLPALEPLLARTGTLPVDPLQALFALLEPWGVADKYRGFAQLDPDSDRARLFVALEDWLNDGVTLAAPVARDCLAGWYGANSPAAGDWRIAGRPVRPADCRLPSLAVIPDHDRIVPPRSALALAEALPDVEVLRPAAGHIGMVAGSRAEEAVWRPLRSWLRTLPDAA